MKQDLLLALTCSASPASLYLFFLHLCCSFTDNLKTKGNMPGDLTRGRCRNCRTSSCSGAYQLSPKKIGASERTSLPSSTHAPHLGEHHWCMKGWLDWKLLAMPSAVAQDPLCQGSPKHDVFETQPGQCWAAAPARLRGSRKSFCAQQRLLVPQQCHGQEAVTFSAITDC